MQIYNINPMNFYARKTMPNKKITNVVQENSIAKKDIFYSDIEKYLKKEYNKDEYLEAFINNIKQDNFKDKIDSLEKKYINDLMTNIDLLNNYKEIPESYITERILDLLNNKK